MNISKLASQGGKPYRSDPMPARLALGKQEKNMILKCIDYYNEKGLDPGYEGYFEKKYCEKFSKFMGGGYADAVATGTAAVYIALAALQLPKNSTVLVSPITDPGTISAIILNNLRPKLVDTMPGSYNIGPDQVKLRIDKDVSCLLVVHSVGEPAPIDRLCDIAKANNIKVLEDCSQAHGSTYKNKVLGSFGNIAAFSTMYRKGHMTGASGGVVFTKNLDLHRLSIAYADRGKPRWDKNFNDRDPSGYLFPAMNFNTDEISCAIGIASLGRLKKSNIKRKKFINNLINLLQKSKYCSPYNFNEDFAPFIFPINFDGNKFNKLKFAKHLIHEGIPLNPNYSYIVDEWKWVTSYLSDKFNCENAKKQRDRSFCLYLNENYGIREAKDICGSILKIEKYVNFS